MKIPDHLKIGGFNYKVEITDNISIGYQYTGEIDYRKQIISLRPNSSESYMERTLIHEMCHAIYDFLGYDVHDEKKIDELANALHMVIKDNPEVFKEV